jgi:hypothetical protein
LPTFFDTLFEGTENIKRGEWFKIVTGNGEDKQCQHYRRLEPIITSFPSNNLN